MPRVHFYALDERYANASAYVHNGCPTESLIRQFAESAMPVGWILDESDRDFIAQCDRFTTEEWSNAEGEGVEVVLKDGEPIGTLDRNITLDGYESLDALQLREDREEAARESYYDMVREERELQRRGIV